MKSKMKSKMKVKINYTIMTLVTLLCTVYINQLQAQTNEYFVTIWNTEEGDPGGTTIKLPITEGIYDVDVNNDGDFDDSVDLTNQIGTITIDFTTAGEYIIAVRPNPTNNARKLLRINHFDAVNGQIGTPVKLTSIDKWGDIVWTSMESAFDSCSNMTFADNAGVPDLTMVTSMFFTFYGATSFNGDLSNWNVSNVTNMENTFQDATNFNGDLSTWNVSNVNSMAGTFLDATNFNGDLSTWNVSNVNSMAGTFSGATSFSSENYDSLLTEWAKLTLQDDVDFTVPPTTYCSGEAGRDILINTYNWTIEGDNGLDCPVAPFVTTWNTETGDPGNATIKLPITTGAYDVDVNNDGDFDDSVDLTNQTGTITIDFVTPGIYSIAVRPNPTNNASKQLRIDHGDSGDTPEKLMSIDKWGDIVWTSMRSSFEECSNMTLVDNAGVPDLTMVTSMWDAFVGATSFNGNISTWNVSNVTDMDGMFKGATNFNGDLSSWSVSNVRDIRDAFQGATSFNGNISTWNVSNVTTMWNTFNGASSFNGDLSAWNVSNVTSMTSTFEGASSFNGDLSSWNVSNLERIGDTFRDATSFNGNISTWNVSNVNNMAGTFWGASSFNGDLSNWDVSNVTSMFRTFDGASSFNGNISTWNVSNVVRIGGTFRDATSFNGDLSTWNVSNVTSMLSTFFGATSFNGNISSWNVSNVTDMSGTFAGATNFNGDLSSWNVSNVIYMAATFLGATSFNSDISSWDVSNVVVSNPLLPSFPGMTDIFKNATSFSSENYDALLTEWAKLTLQDDITFGAPPTTYCSGEAGRNILINTYNWTIDGDNGLDCPVTSVDEEFLSNTKIYPNSTNGKINIESSFTIDKLELYNVLGAKLFSVSKTNVLDLTSLRQGVYILKVFSEDRVISKKIIKD